MLLTPLLRRDRSTGQKPPEAQEVPQGSRTAVLLLVLASVGVALFAVAALSEPMWAVDYLAIWGLKGKTIFLTASMPGRLFHDPATVWSHPEYPVLWPLDLAAMAAWARGWDDRALALLDPVCQAGTALAAFGFLRRRRLAVGGAVAAALIAWFFPLYAPAFVGLADIPLAFGFVLLGTALLDAFDADTPAVRARLAVAALFCAALKQEGVLLAALAAVAWLARRPRGRPAALVTLALAAPVVLQAAVLRLARGPVASRDFDFGLLTPARWGQWLGQAGDAVREITRTQIAGTAVPLAAIVVFVLVTRRGVADPLGHVLVGQAALYVLAVSLCAFGPAFLVETALARIACALFPLLALVLGARVGDPTQSVAAQ
jgi:hypothetical protein